MLVNSQCEQCGGQFEFEDGGYNPGDKFALECPHCQVTRSIVMPDLQATPPVISVHAPSETVWFGSEESFVTIRLTSGSSHTIKAVRLYNEAKLQELSSKKAEAMELLGGGSSPFGYIGSIGWVAINQWIDKQHSKVLVQKGASLYQEVLQLERKLREYVVFFPVGRVQDIEHPSPGLWRVPVNTVGFIHNGDEFITVKDVDGLVRSIRWSSVEYFSYQAKQAAA